MPTVKMIDGIKICIYNGDHEPPHIHAHYAGHSIKIDIETLSVLKMDGRFPSKNKK